jgi:GT2 family glycosyltransferase
VPDDGDAHRAARRFAASIVIPTRNRHEVLAELLADLAAQDLGRDRFEIIVVDNGSYPPVGVPDGVRLIQTARRGLNRARNAGARAALSDLVWFLDDDVAVPPQWLRELVLGNDRHPQASCFGGPVHVRMEAEPARWLCRWCTGATGGESPLDLGGTEGPVEGYVNGGNLGVRKRALVEVGYFDEGVPFSGEESEWEDRVRAAGGAIVYLPRAWLWHRRTTEQMRFRRRLSRSFRQGRGNAYHASSTGTRPKVGSRRLLRSLAHAARRGCAGGLFQASWAAGFMVGTLEFAVRGRRLRPRR